MRYKNINSGPTQRTQELRRMWEVLVYDGDPDDPNVTTSVETVVAWNAVDATRRSGKPVAAQPKALYYVTWPEYEGGPIYRIDNPSDGAIKAAEEVPTIGDPEGETW